MKNNSSWERTVIATALITRCICENKASFRPGRDWSLRLKLICSMTTLNSSGMH